MDCARFRALLICILLLTMGLPARAGEVDATPLVIETAQGPVEFSVELALTPDQRSIGLMNRASMERNRGMLFRFEETRDVMMWMKNTILPLDMIFIRQDGVVAGIAADTVPFSENIVSSPGPVRFVLEVNAGVTAQSGIAPGDLVRHPAMAP